MGFLAMVFALAQDSKSIATAGFCQGYSPLVWGVVCLSAVGGLSVAVVLKHADNILKCFATAISVILTCFLSIAVLGEFTLDGIFVLGVALVLSSSALYSLELPRHGFMGTDFCVGAWLLPGRER